jgi:S-adenosylmethionine/arginine decarboxylase-like enzyme
MIRLSKSLNIITTRVPWGWSTSLDLKQCNYKVKDKADLKDYIYQVCDLIDMKRFGECQIYKFGTGNKAGYSMLQLIETSNITGHFCDDNNSGYIDIFSCKPYDAKKLAVFTKRFFEADSMVYNTIERW